MCGITGYWARRADPAPWLADLGGSVASLRSRGPDDQGAWVRPGGRLALGHTRLSILDLSPAGHQPMKSADGSLTMVFNGEVYNFAAVRAELEGLGHRFRSSGDSEVILAAIQQWGVKAVDKFIGMFAIAVWNEHEHRLLLLRDRLGVKPLYYAWNGTTLWFGSELKALRAFRAWVPEVDADALGEFLQFGYISAPRSIYRDVHKLKPGHWLELGEVGEPVSHAYWAPPDCDEPLSGCDEEIERHLEHLLIDAFRYRMVSDVPVGVFLSGGIDSTAVAALLQRYGGGEVRTFTVGFEEAGFDEASHARRVAQHLGTKHTEQILRATDMRDALLGWGDLFDEPFGDSSGVPTYLVARMARESVKVALSADGGDELFGGYSHYGLVQERERALKRLPLAARRAMARSLGAATLLPLAERLPLPGRWRHTARRTVIDRLEKLRLMLPDIDRQTLYDLSLTSWTPPEIAALMGRNVAARERFEVPGAGIADFMSRDDLRHYLPDDILVKVDRTTMATGLEGREPLLDHRLVEFALRLPPHLRSGALGTKHLLRKIVYKHVPRELLERPKQGFSVPLAQWMRGELAPLVDQYLAPDRIRDAGLLDPDQVSRCVANFREGGEARDRVDTQKLWYLLAFEMWRERWMKPADVVPLEPDNARAVCH